MKRLLSLIFFAACWFSTQGQITLSGTSYTQSFDGVGTSLPSGFRVSANATAASLGTAATFNVTQDAWNSTTSGWKNVASADGLTSSSGSAVQNASTDRVVGIRQSGSTADPGAALEFQLANTTGFSNFNLSFKLQSLDVSSERVTTWLVQYGTGTSPASFTTVATSPATLTTGGFSFSNNTISVNFGAVLDNIGQNVWIRIVALTGSSGANNRATTGFDDISLTYSNISSCTPPSTQASAASITGVTGNSMNVNWTGGNGTNSLVVVKSGSSVAGSPVSGTAYTANAAFGSSQAIATGEYVVYNSTGNSVAVTGLSSGTTYHAAVYSFNSADNCYNTTGPATANATTIVVCTEPTTQANSITANASSTTAVINWTAGNGSNSLVKINTANSFTGPSDGVTYTANTAYAGGEQVIYAGTGNSVTVTGLTVLTTYYVTVYTYNPCSSSPDYLASGNTVQSFSTINNTGEPANYYNSTAGLSCAALKTALRTIINTGFTHQSYSDLWTIYQTGDIHQSDFSTANVIWDIYSDNPTGNNPYEFTPVTDQCGSYGGEGDCYNREHSFPQSWFGGGTSAGPGTDYHHIFPTDGYVNGHRSNYPYGRVGSASYTSDNGSKLGTSNWSGITGTVFEPINAYKGDVARAFLYMVTCYQNNMASWENQDASGNVAMDGTTWPSVEPAYLQLMMAWHNLDPVSQKEIDRNNAGYGFQGNRNPFVDHPEYVDQIWGASCSSLPADLISFTGKYQSGSVLLNWNIANADHFSKFEVERSYDGRNFSTSGTVDYIPGLNGYAFNETATMSGDIYYRLKMVDLNGVSKYSRIINVSVPELPVLVSVYPNPAGDYLTVTLHKSNPVSYPVRITDLTGQTVFTSFIPAGEMNYKLPVNKLTAGLYVLTIKSDSEITHIRFVKQ